MLYRDCKQPQCSFNFSKCAFSLLMRSGGFLGFFWVFSPYWKVGSILNNSTTDSCFLFLGPRKNVYIFFTKKNALLVGNYQTEPEYGGYICAMVR